MMVLAWAADAGWQVATVDVREGEVIVTALGPPPEADPADLRQILNVARRDAHECRAAGGGQPRASHQHCAVAIVREAVRGIQAFAH